MKRIGIDGHVLTGKFQGSRTWLLEILRRAPALTPEITYVVYSDDVEACRALVDAPNIEHRPLPVKSAALRILAYWPYAIVAHSLDFLVTQYMAPLLFGREQIVVVHDILFQTHPQFFPFKTRWRNRILVWLSAIRANTVVTVSEFSRKAIAQKYHLQESRIAIVRNGVSPKTAVIGALPEQLSADQPFFLFVGRLEPRKNVKLALDALDLVEDANAKLVVVGRDDFEHPHTLERLRANPRVIHLTDVPDERLAALYAHAKALLYPSEGEGWGIPVQEAMAFGCPVIASNATAIPEAGGSSCTYIDVHTPNAAHHFAAKMTLAHGDKLLFDKLAAAKHLAAHDWDVSARAFALMVQGVVERETEEESPIRSALPSA